MGEERKMEEYHRRKEIHILCGVVIHKPSRTNKEYCWCTVAARGEILPRAEVKTFSDGLRPSNIIRKRR